MKKIIVAGAGHGGLVAAFNLAKSGFDVTVIEKNKRESLGYDWKDSMAIKAFNDCGFENPDEKDLHDYEIMSFYNPSMTVKVSPRKKKISSVITINRKFLINYLIDNCISAGVKFLFETPVVRAICDDFGVIGIETEQKKIYCDLVIDACGIFSPVRRTLNPKFGISNNIAQKDTFYVYRAYYERTAQGKTDPRFSVTFDHCGHTGMDWIVTDEDDIDILVGGFGSLTWDDVDKSVADYRKKFPYFENNIISGGEIYTIPIGKMLPLIVCNGYAAIGDSVSMIEPLAGSGITFSMRTGKMLADTVLEAQDFSKKSLWKYNYLAFTKIGKKYLLDDIVKGLLGKLTLAELDYLFEKKILSDKEMLDKANVKYTPLEVVEKLTTLSKNPMISVKLLAAAKDIGYSMLVAGSIPKEYNSVAVNKWVKKYNKI